MRRRPDSPASEDDELNPLQSREARAAADVMRRQHSVLTKTHDEVREILRQPAKSILKEPVSEEEWKRRRKAPKSRTRIAFIGLPSEGGARSGEVAALNPEPELQDAAIDPPLAMTDDERKMILGDSQEESGDSNSQTRSSDEALSNSSDDVARAIQMLGGNFAVNPVTLTFVDGDLEKEYVKFVVSQQGFAAGKLYASLAGAISIGLLFPYMNFEMTAEKWGQIAVVVTYVGVSIGWLMFGLMFLKQTLPIRELIFFIAVATHWPAFATTTLLAKEDQAYRYAYTTLCFTFCCFIAQPRFVGMFFFLTLTPIATCFIATFTKTDYWESHSYFEMLYWPMPLFPLLMLRSFERRSREAFVENAKGHAALEVMAHREELTKKIISRFFPLSASQRLLKTGGTEQHAMYPRSALVLTKVVDFTEWAAQTSAELVVSRIAGMFVTMERLGRRYGVEKVTTLGDMYLGAIFSRVAKRTKPDVLLDDHDLSLSNSSSVIDQGAHSAASGSSGGGAGRSNSNPLAQTLARGAKGGDTQDVETNADRSTGTRASVGLLSMSGTSSADSDPALVSYRCHRALRFATAVRHHRDVMPVRIGVHVGNVIGGFVGIQPPKFDLFGSPVQRLQVLEEKGRKRRVHASQEIIEAAAGLGQPSADFETSDVNGQIFSSWRSATAEGEAMASSLKRFSPQAALETAFPTAPTARSEGSSEGPAQHATGDAANGSPRRVQAAENYNSSNHTMQHSALEESADAPGLRHPCERVVVARAAAESSAAVLEKSTPDCPAMSEAEVQRDALRLCTYLQRFGEAQREKAHSGYESREALLRKSLRKRIAGEGRTGKAATADMPPSPRGLNAEEMRAMEELDELDRVSDAGSVDRVSDDNVSPVGDHDGAEQNRLLGDDDVLQIRVAGEELELYRIDFSRMRFNDPAVETQYRNRLIHSGLHSDVYSMFASMTMYILLAHVANSCSTTDQDRGLMLIIGVALLLNLGYWRYFDTRHRKNIAITLVTYGGIAWLAAILYELSCHRPHEVKTAGNIVALYFTQYATAPAFSLELWLPIRMAIVVACAAQFCLAVLMRRTWHRDNVLIWDGLWACVIAANAFLSFFAELASRSGFQSTMRRRALVSHQSEISERTAEALETMIPNFVVERLMRAARRSDNHIGIDFADTDSVSSGGSGATRLSQRSALSAHSAHSSLLGAAGGRIQSKASHLMLLRKSETVWPYPRAVVMFVWFEPARVSYDAVSDTVMRIEAVARSRSIQKVKTIGTTVLLVAGIEKGQQFEDAAVNAVDAALEIQRRVFPPHLTEGWSHRIGLHVGPIFGAVIGSQGLAFDVYGDTVNTAYEIKTSAPANSIRCTASMRAALPLNDVDLAFVLVGVNMPVVIKGKGKVSVFQVVERDRHRTPGSLAAVGVVAEPIENTDARPSVPQQDDETNSDIPGSQIAESIRSSLRSAAMLPSAAAQFEMDTETAFTSSRDASSARRSAPGASASDEPAEQEPHPAHEVPPAAPEQDAPDTQALGRAASSDPVQTIGDWVATTQPSAAGPGPNPSAAGDSHDEDAPHLRTAGGAAAMSSSLPATAQNSAQASPSATKYPKRAIDSDSDDDGAAARALFAGFPGFGGKGKRGGGGLDDDIAGFSDED